MTRIDVLASEVHFADHVAAVLLALPPSARGRAIARTDEVAARFESHGITPTRAPIGAAPILVASIGDLRTARRVGREHVAIMEHGAGQSYGGSSASARHPSYAGGNRRDADLFLHPGNHPAERDRRAYPDARIEVVGSPFLDTMPARIGPPGRVVAITSHFDATISPEATSGFAWARPGLERLVGRYEILGTGHPKGGFLRRIAHWYTRYGIEVVADFREILRRADVLIFDNTSAGFAFAASGRPVVVLNPPEYRTDVHHGLRFWTAATVGVNVSAARDIPDAVERALELRPEDVAAREAALDVVYAHRTGAAARAAAALIDWSATLGRRLEAIA